MSASIAIRKYGYLTLVIILILAASLAVYHFSQSFFEINSIEVVGTAIKIEIDQNKISKNLLFFPDAKLREQILKDNPLVADVIFKKQFPHTLIISIIIRAPVAIIETPSGIMGVDKDGILLPEPADKHGLPVLKFNLSEAAVGQKISRNEILESLEFISETENFIQLLSVESSGSALLAKSAKTDIIFAQNEKVGDTATTLQTLLVGFRIKGNLPVSIDLRFDKPIVKF